MFDGKKILPQSADVYLMEQEDPPKLYDLKSKHEQNVSAIEQYKFFLQNVIDSDEKDVSEIVSEDRIQYTIHASKALQATSSVIRELRTSYAKKLLICSLQKRS